MFSPGSAVSGLKTLVLSLTQSLNVYKASVQVGAGVKTVVSGSILVLKVIVPPSGRAMSPDEEDMASVSRTV